MCKKYKNFNTHHLKTLNQTIIPLMFNRRNFIINKNFINREKSGRIMKKRLIILRSQLVAGDCKIIQLYALCCLDVTIIFQ